MLSFSRLKNLALYAKNEFKTFYENFLPETIRRIDFGSLKGKRLIVLAHFDVDKQFDPAFIFLAEKMKQQLNAKLMVVSTNSDISKFEIDKLAGFVDCLVLRRNFGQDFGSWKTGLELIKQFDDYRSITLMNDTVYGPFVSIQNFVEKIEDQNQPVVGGMTDNFEITHHLQSYFLIFNRTCVKSEWFQNFWKNYRKKHGRAQNIKGGEIALSRQAIKNGIELIPMFAYEKIKSFILLNKKPIEPWRERLNVANVNPYHFFWKELIENFGFPFIKVELLKLNPSQIGNLNEYKEVVEKFTNHYPVSLIENHVNRLKSRERAQ